MTTFSRRFNKAPAKVASLRVRMALSLERCLSVAQRLEIGHGKPVHPVAFGPEPIGKLAAAQKLRDEIGGLLDCSSSVNELLRLATKAREAGHAYRETMAPEHAEAFKRLGEHLAKLQ